MLRPLIPALLLVCALPAVAERVWQPVIDYSMTFPGDRPDAAPIINPFENFTHFASDFGWMGPGESRIDCRGGVIHVKPGEHWTGAWHSLAGLASQSHRTLDPTDLTGLGDPTSKRTEIRELSVNASGKGTFRVELADVDRLVVWGRTVTLDTDNTSTFGFPVDPAAIGRIKFLNWVAEPGCHLRLSSIGFLVERPDIPLEEWAFRVSLGKLRRSHDSASGLTRDRGHLPPGTYDSIASTGLQALGSALGAAEGIIDRDTIIKEIKTTLVALRALPKAGGFLPHFVHRDDSGKITIHPGTEFSTVDTAIALQSLLLATTILELPEERAEVVSMIAALDFDAITSPEGWISHGYLDDGKTLLTSSWRDWGGESALVLALEGMVPDRTPRGKMSASGQPYRGVGFIAEIQSLLYPDFDRPEPDLISHISWPETRRNLLARQNSYFVESIPDSRAARSGIFGVSAGEAGMPGAGYTANGIEAIGLRWIHPHYMLMGLALSSPDRYPEGLRALLSTGHLYPVGLPENIEVGLKLHNPMQGSLNAAFETLATYHGWKKRETPANLLDQASRKDPLVRQAASRFYAPQSPP